MFLSCRSSRSFLKEMLLSEAESLSPGKDLFVMKKTAENLYPHSATLFHFCKEALALHYEGNVKVIDQDVGAILGYDPADCSHWKKGKKNIRALSTLRSIADHLRIDERLLVSIAAGEIGLQEALFEYKGYGNFNLRERPLESLKKEFFKNPARWQTEGSIRTFEELFDLDRPGVAKAAQEVLSLGNFNEAPVYVPEIFSLFANITLAIDESLEEPLVVTTAGEGADMTTVVRYRDHEMKPYVRFLLVKELGRFLWATKHPVVSELKPVPREVLDIQSNIFAGMLLIPDHLLKREVDKLDSSLDVVTQLTDIFWVSKSLLNNRLRDYMENIN